MPFYEANAAQARHAAREAAHQVDDGQYGLVTGDKGWI